MKRWVSEYLAPTRRQRRCFWMVRGLYSSTHTRIKKSTRTTTPNSEMVESRKKESHSKLLKTYTTHDSSTYALMILFHIHLLYYFFSLFHPFFFNTTLFFFCVIFSFQQYSCMFMSVDCHLLYIAFSARCNFICSKQRNQHRCYSFFIFLFTGPFLLLLFLFNFVPTLVWLCAYKHCCRRNEDHKTTPKDNHRFTVFFYIWKKSWKETKKIINI